MNTKSNYADRESVVNENENNLQRFITTAVTGVMYIRR